LISTTLNPSLRPWLALALLSLAPACGGASASLPANATLVVRAEQHDALGLSDALEALIAEGKDTPEDRDYAYREIKTREAPTAAYAFARAAITGRYVQAHGLTQGPLAAEVERYARQSRALDPKFRNSAATRMLGTLYAIAPAGLLKHGNSEDGVTLLEGLVKAHPEVVENHLRLAEAYLALGDKAAATAPLCRAIQKKADLRPDDQKLLSRLINDAGNPRCEDAAPAAPGAAMPAPPHP
jgi:predicted Zn-dependent protease